MAILWIGAVVFLVLLFVFIVPALDNSGIDVRYVEPPVRYSQRQEVQPAFAQRAFTRPPGRVGGQPLLVFAFLVFLLFVGAVIFWSVAAQAGGL